MSGKVYLLGWPVGHSLSPRMQEAAFRRLGLDWRYSALGVRPRDLARVLADISADPDFRGANVTTPHKGAALRLLPDVDAYARGLGAVNVISRRDGGPLRGHNTDAAGLLGALGALGFAVNGAGCVVLGAGGAARACVAALASAGAASVRVVSRRPGQARDLTRELQPFVAAHAPAASLATGAWSELETLLEGWDVGHGRQGRPETGRLLVNATPVGMWPDDGESPLSPAGVALIPPGTLVFDLIYNPPRTRLVKMAAAAGRPAAGGEEMLVLQGAAALGHWLSEPVGPDVVAEMRRAIVSGMEGSACSGT